ncbi:hypothetical protein JGI7_02296 [Candidatus Kryptonium thompsonii]|nr:hypothetical protein JGI7_02296 [Candidatus Kryptonium thompsoni]
MKLRVTTLMIFLLILALPLSAQKAYIKIKGMSPHELEGMGIANLDSISSSLGEVKR